MTESKKWKMWRSVLDVKTCKDCREKHGKIYKMVEIVKPRPPLHINCRCIIEKMKVILAGNATHYGTKGADWYLKYYGKLPDYYLSKEEAKSLGWRHKKGNLQTIVPGKMIFGGIYDNDDNKLPTAADRIWYEADINYQSGHRNAERIVFSSDGLIFATYNHYETFFEIK